MWRAKSADDACGAHEQPPDLGNANAMNANATNTTNTSKREQHKGNHSDERDAFMPEQNQLRSSNSQLAHDHHPLPIQLTSQLRHHTKLTSPRHILGTSDRLP